jgi:hypothetical protein
MERLGNKRLTVYFAIQVYRRFRSRCRTLFSPSSTAGAHTEPRYVRQQQSWPRLAIVASLTENRVLALPGQTRDFHRVSTLWFKLDRHGRANRYSIGDSDEPLGRMLGTLRFWFSKDLVRYTREARGARR